MKVDFGPRPNRALTLLPVPPEQWDEYLQSMTGAEKVALSCAANTACRQMHTERLRCEHPDWTDQQIQAEIARLFLGRWIDSYTWEVMAEPEPEICL